MSDPSAQRPTIIDESQEAVGGFEARFGGIGRLYSREGLVRLRSAHVCVVGLGGVGSWAVEALARSGIGKLTLVDLDDVCVSNVNRQLHAVDGEIGRAKAEAMAARVRAINPESVVAAVQDFFTPASADRLLGVAYDFLIDAIDNVSNKCELIAQCHRRRIPVITVGGAGGRRDPTAIKIADLAFSTHDPLLQAVRKELRQRYSFPREGPFGVVAVFSPEPIVYPGAGGTVCAETDPKLNLRLDCDSGYGTASFVTGTFGFVAAAHVVKTLASNAVDRESSLKS